MLLGAVLGVGGVRLARACTCSDTKYHSLIVRHRDPVTDGEGEPGSWSRGVAVACEQGCAVAVGFVILTL